MSILSDWIGIIGEKSGLKWEIFEVSRQKVGLKSEKIVFLPHKPSSPIALGAGYVVRSLFYVGFEHIHNISIG